MPHKTDVGLVRIVIRYCPNVQHNQRYSTLYFTSSLFLTIRLYVENCRFKSTKLLIGKYFVSSLGPYKVYQHNKRNEPGFYTAGLHNQIIIGLS